MGYFKVHRVNEGIQIRNGTETIDVVVRGVNGSRTEREADLEVRSGRSVREIHLRPSDGLVPVSTFVEVGISNQIKIQGNKVCLHYRAPFSYSFEEKKYEPE